jgi:hypothetical protein
MRLVMYRVPCPPYPKKATGSWSQLRRRSKAGPEDGLVKHGGSMSVARKTAHNEHSNGYILLYLQVHKSPSSGLMRHMPSTPSRGPFSPIVLPLHASSFSR